MLRSLLTRASLVVLASCQGAAGFSVSSMLGKRSSTLLFYGNSRGDYYGESSGSFMVKEFNLYDQLQEIVQLAAQPLPERPDGIICVVKFTSSLREDCRMTEAEYERMARENPATIFLRCFAEYDNADLLLAQAAVTTWPSYDVFSGGNRVARVEGGSIPELEELLNMYQFQNSNLDLFSENANNAKRLAWGDGKLADPMKTPRTTNRFIPGYDWDKDRGFFDDLGDQAQRDFEKMFGEWVPNTEDR